MPPEYQWAALMLVLIGAFPLSVVLVRLSGRVVLGHGHLSRSRLLGSVERFDLASLPSVLVKG